MLINTLIVCPIFNQEILMSKNISIIDTCVFFFSHTQVSTHSTSHAYNLKFLYQNIIIFQKKIYHALETKIKRN